MPSQRDDVLETYRYLRLAMPLLVVVLTASVAFQIVAFDCWPSSISAYYYTASRAVLVSCLCAIGTCLVVYSGNTTSEDVVLNAAGALAFVVAFVPTTVDTACRASNIPSRTELVDAVHNNVTALLVGAGVTVLVAWVVRGRAGAPRHGPLATGPLAGTTVALAVGTLVFVLADDLVLRFGHYTAAVAMLVAIALVVWMNTRWYTDRRDGMASPTARYDLAYRLVLAAMVVSAVVITATGLLLGREPGGGPWRWAWVFWLEAALVVEFAVFWTIQTSELWGVRDRTQLHLRRTARAAPALSD